MGVQNPLWQSTMLALLVFVAALAGANGEALSLNKDNFDAQVYDSGKNAIVKFLAPW